MMKRIGNIYEKICDFENLYEAYLEARKNKRFRYEVLRFSANLDNELIAIQTALKNKTYEIGEYRQFVISEPKKRLIMALQFRDRVVQWAIYRQLNPLFDRQFIEDSYACRVGKGTHTALDRLQYWLRKVNRTGKTWYCLKMDISKYFYRVDHRVLMTLLERKIKEKDLLWLLGAIVNSDRCAFGLPLDANISDSAAAIRLTECGMPIGNLTSQMFANLYLNEVDQYVKHELREHYYIRYMDDMLILCDDKAKLHEIKDNLAQFLDEHLHLNLNNKTSIRPVYLGIEFVGFRIWATHRKLRKTSAKKLKRGLKHLKYQYAKGYRTLDQIRPNIMSYFGVLKHFNSYNLRKKISEVFVLQREAATAAEI
jgi:retron-type reverse transcriptase